MTWVLYPLVADLDGVIEEQPRSTAPSDYGSVPESDGESKRSWKLYPDKGAPSFTVQIRKQDT